MKDIGDLTDLISQIRLYEKPYKAIIMHSINKVLYTTFRQEGDNSIEIFFNRTPVNHLTPILEKYVLHPTIYDLFLVLCLLH